jgi:DNA-binding MarR family transcriptional regulator
VRPNITLAIRRLETLGLVKRSRDPADLRLVLVGITPKGLALHRKSLTKALAPLERLAGHADTRRCDGGSQTRR